MVIDTEPFDKWNQLRIAVMGLNENDIKWWTYRGEAGDLQTMLVAEYNGVRFSSLYTEAFIFRFNFSKWLAKRRIRKAINLLHAKHWM